MTKRDAVIEMETLARKYSALVNESLSDSPYSRPPDLNRCISALQTLGDLCDRHSLPLFEEIVTGAKHDTICICAMSNYFRVAGTLEDFLPFIERVVTNPSSPEFGRRIAYQSLDGLIQGKGAPPPSSEDIAKICVFMLGWEKAESGEMVRRLDGLLNQHIPGYKNSVQRKEVAEA